MVAAAGVAAEILSEAAGAVRNITGELLSDSRDSRRIDMCSCVVTVAAAEHNTAEGAVVTAVGGAAGDPSDHEAAGIVGIFTGELRSGDSSDLRQIDMCSCVVTMAAATPNFEGGCGCCSQG